MSEAEATSTALEKPRERVIRLPIGLLLSIGEEKPVDQNRPGRSIDYFRPKPGDLNQYAAEAKKFTETYGEKPDTIDDIYFLANEVPDVLDIRLLAFSKSGIRGIGQTNYATITDDTEFEERVFGPQAFEDDFLFFPRDVNEVRAELRENWQGEPIPGHLEGKDDPRVKRLDVKVVASLEFCLPKIMGVGKVARISTSGRTSMRNLWKALWTEWIAFGNLAGVQFRLANRPRRKTYFDAEKRAMMPTTIRELVLDTPHTIQELYEAIEERRKALGPAGTERERMAAEGAALARRLALPAAPEEEERTREEVDATASDPLLNKIASLEAEIGEPQALAVLRGVFGVEAATELSAEDAERYWQMLERALPETEEVDEADVQVIDAIESEDSAVEETAEEATAVVVDSEAAETDSGAATGEAAVPPPAATPSPAPEESLPGEPPDDGALIPAIEIALDEVVPKGSRRGRPLRDLLQDQSWFEYCLRHPEVWTDNPTLYAAMEFVARERLPDLWKKVRG